MFQHRKGGIQKHSESKSKHMASTNTAMYVCMYDVLSYTQSRNKRIN